ncbi:unnamed protein product [Allacma fusca]|uniref:Uncharacterized protein n=1 Tax=Allacma fusca TaxID=39272 RepID=A0A8J2PMF4_9HEXA|nr:unnamed protein product [Allacma fusca]
MTSHENKQARSPAATRAVHPSQSQSNPQEVTSKRVTKNQKDVTGVKPKEMGAASTPELKVKAVLPGNASKTLKLAQRRVVPVANQKQKVSPKMIPKRAVNPPASRPIASPIFNKNDQNKQRFPQTKAVSTSSGSSEDSDESDDSLLPKIKDIKPLPLLIKNESKVNSMGLNVGQNSMTDGTHFIYY